MMSKDHDVSESAETVRLDVDLLSPRWDDSSEDWSYTEPEPDDDKEPEPRRLDPEFAVVKEEPYEPPVQTSFTGDPPPEHKEDLVGSDCTDVVPMEVVSEMGDDDDEYDEFEIVPFQVVTKTWRNDRNCAIRRWRSLVAQYICPLSLKRKVRIIRGNTLKKLVRDVEALWREDDEFNVAVADLIKHIQCRYYNFQMKVQKDLMAKVECKLHAAKIFDQRIEKKRDLLKKIQNSVDPTDILARKIGEFASKEQTLPVDSGPQFSTRGEHPIAPPSPTELNGHALGPFCSAPCSFECSLNC